MQLPHASHYTVTRLRQSTLPHHSGNHELPHADILHSSRQAKVCAHSPRSQHGRQALFLFAAASICAVLLKFVFVALGA